MSLSYGEAERLLARARSLFGGKPLEYNTWLHRRGDDFVVRLHRTDVVTIHPGDTYTLRSGGWQTPTTKRRICAYAGVEVFSYQNEWYLDGGTRFFSGIRVDTAGRALNAPVEAELNAWQREELRYTLRRGVALLVDWCRNQHQLPPQPDAPCAGCLTQPTHTLHHIPEGYGAPVTDGTLLWHALGFAHAWQHEAMEAWWCTRQALLTLAGDLGDMERLLRRYTRSLLPALYAARPALTT